MRNLKLTMDKKPHRYYADVTMLGNGQIGDVSIAALYYIADARNEHGERLIGTENVILTDSKQFKAMAEHMFGRYVTGSHCRAQTRKQDARVKARAARIAG